MSHWLFETEALQIGLLYRAVSAVVFLLRQLIH